MKLISVAFLITSMLGFGITGYEAIHSSWLWLIPMSTFVAGIAIWTVRLHEAIDGKEKGDDSR